MERYVGKIALTAAIALSAICAIAAGDDDERKFETASVKRMDRGIIYNSLGPGTVILRGDPLKVILMEAFNMKGYQIVGPSWLNEDCFEIVAKMPADATSDQIPAMLQALLLERFKLTAHKEDRPRSVYALVLDKGGPKFKQTNSSVRRFGPPQGGVTFRMGPDNQGFKGSMTLTKLAQFLSGKLDRPVQDFTGLEGTYDIDLAWAPDPGIDRATHSDDSVAPATAASSGAQGVPPATPTANLFTAIRESLGLKLDPREAPVQMLVIDHVQRIPTEN